MPPITVQRTQSDGNGGWFIEWHDAANVDGKPVTGFFHLTESSIAELILHQRRPNRAPQDKLEKVFNNLTAGHAAATVAANFRDAYEEVIEDRIDRHNLGLKAVTRHGHADLEAVRGGAEVRPENAIDPRPTGFKDFIRS